MNEFILSKFPGMKISDIRLQDDGEGIFISYWNSDQPKPTDEQVRQWVDEYNNQSKPLTEIEQLQKDQADLMIQLLMKGVI